MDEVAREPLDFRPTERLRPSGRPAQPTDGLVVAGYVTGVLLPVVGFFIGFALLLKNRFGHGVAVMVLSVAVTVLATVLILSAVGDAGAVSTADCIERALLPEDALKCVE